LIKVKYLEGFDSRIRCVMLN